MRWRGFFAPSEPLHHRISVQWFPSPRNLGEDADPLRAVRRPSARRRLGRVPAGPARKREAAAVGPGPHGDPGKWKGSSARAWHAEPHPCRSTRRARRAVGNGGGGKMLLPLGRDRRIVGRSARARLHRDPAACGRGGTQRHAVLAGAPRRSCQPQRRADALAPCKRAVADQRARSARARSAGMGRRTVPRSGIAAWAMECHA